MATHVVLIFWILQDKSKCLFKWKTLPTLTFSISLASWTGEMWMALGADPLVASQILGMLMEKLLIMAPYVDQRESMMRGGTKKVATSQPLAVSPEHSRTRHWIRHVYSVLDKDDDISAWFSFLLTCTIHTDQSKKSTPFEANYKEAFMCKLCMVFSCMYCGWICGCPND